MAITNPSQYDCDNAQKGDLIIIKPRLAIYKWYRARFQKYKTKLKVRKDWNSDERIEAYQEDCTLIFSWEIQGRSEYNDEIPYYTGLNNKYFQYGKKLKLLQFGSENVSIVLKGGFSILIPTTAFRTGLDRLDNARKYIDENRQIQEALKFARYKGDFFKRKCEELDLKEWTITYCNVCGEPVKIKFDKEEPYVENTCKCGNMLVKNETINWDTVAYWYNRQIQKPYVDAYKEFWKI